MTTKDIRALLEDLADQTSPAELTAPALRKARRIRARRWGLAVTGAMTGALVALTLPFLVVAPTTSGTPAATPSPTGPAPVVLPGGWILGNGWAQEQMWIYDRTQGRYRTVPYHLAIPAPVGDLVFVEKQDGWAGVLNLRTAAVMQVTANRFMDWSIDPPEWSADGKRLLRLARFGRAFVTDAVTGESREIPLEGGPCQLCLRAVWMPGEQEIAALGGSEQVGIYSVIDGRKLRSVSYRPGAQAAFSPDGARVVVEEGIVDTATGTVVAPIAESYTMPLAYWAGSDRILLIHAKEVIVYSADGVRMESYPLPVWTNGRMFYLHRLIKP